MATKLVDKLRSISLEAWMNSNDEFNKVTLRYIKLFEEKLEEVARVGNLWANIGPKFENEKVVMKPVFKIWSDNYDSGPIQMFHQNDNIGDDHWEFGINELFVKLYFQNQGIDIKINYTNGCIFTFNWD